MLYNPYMRIIVDADACPVKKEIVKIAKKHGLEVVMLCDTSHVIQDDYARVIIIGEGADAVDFALINHTKKDDIVVSQDYGVASMALAKGAKAISNHGDIFTDGNINSYLTQRHIAKENRRKGGKFRGHARQTKPDKQSFANNLVKLINDSI